MDTFEHEGHYEPHYCGSGSDGHGVVAVCEYRKELSEGAEQQGYI